MADRALGHIKVLDLTHYIAGPLCTRLLADYGAQVIKVERPDTGDGARRLGPFPQDIPDPEKSGLFLYLNTNKRGITLNLKSETGRKLFLELVRWADILVENFEPRVMPSLGLSYEALSRVNPGLVMTSISNFGQTGPYRDYKATDLVLYAMSGAMYISGEYDREPLSHALNQAQKVAGRYAATATLLAYYDRESTGEGQYVDISIMECLNYTLAANAPQYTYMGAIQRRAQKRRRAFESAIPRLVPCKDGYTSIMVRGASMETTLAYLADLLDLPELRDPRYARSDPETEEEVDRLVLNRLLELEMDHLFHKGMGRPVERGRGEGISRRVFVSMVKTPDQVLASEQLRARGYFVEVEHPAAGRLTYPGPWFRMTETPWRVERPAPLLGQHNQEVYCGLLGYSKDDLVRLRALGVI